MKGSQPGTFDTIGRAQEVRVQLRCDAEEGNNGGCLLGGCQEAGVVVQAQIMFQPHLCKWSPPRLQYYHACITAAES